MEEKKKAEITRTKTRKGKCYELCMTQKVLRSNQPWERHAGTRQSRGRNSFHGGRTADKGQEEKWAKCLQRITQKLVHKYDAIHMLPGSLVCRVCNKYCCVKRKVKEWDKPTTPTTYNFLQNNKSQTQQTRYLYFNSNIFPLLVPFQANYTYKSRAYTVSKHSLKVYLLYSHTLQKKLWTTLQINPTVYMK